MKNTWVSDMPIAVIMLISGALGLIFRTAIGPWISYVFDRLKAKPVETVSARNDFEKNQQGHIDRLLAESKENKTVSLQEIKDRDTTIKEKDKEIDLLQDKLHKCELEALKVENTLRIEINELKQKIKSHKFFADGVTTDQLDKFVKARKEQDVHEQERRTSRGGDNTV